MPQAQLVTASFLIKKSDFEILRRRAKKQGKSFAELMREKVAELINNEEELSKTSAILDTILQISMNGEKGHPITCFKKGEALKTINTSTIDGLQKVCKIIKEKVLSLNE